MVKIKEGYGMTRDGRKVRIKRNGELSNMYPYYHDGNIGGFHGLSSEGESCVGIDKDDIVAILDDDATGPVRTVTRRIINRGVYDVVKVGHHDESKSTVAVELVPSSLGFMRTSEQLRSAAMIFSQLAEALDSNEETK